MLDPFLSIRLTAWQRAIGNWRMCAEFARCGTAPCAAHRALCLADSENLDEFDHTCAQVRDLIGACPGAAAAEGDD